MGLLLTKSAFCGALFLLSAHSLDAQQFTAGIKVGVQTTSAVTTDPRVGSFSPLFDHFTFGPEAGVVLAHRLGLEFDALHKHYAYGSYVIGQLHALIGITNTHISYWDFPLMLKWQASRHRLSPFLAGGLAQRHTDVTTHDTSLTGGPPPFTPETLLVNTWTRGPVVSGGLEYTKRHIHIAPEIRYVHWTQPALGAPTIFDTGPALAWQANSNEFQVMLGLTFGNH